MLKPNDKRKADQLVDIAWQIRGDLPDQAYMDLNDLEDRLRQYEDDERTLGSLTGELADVTNRRRQLRDEPAIDLPRNPASERRVLADIDYLSELVDCSQGNHPTGLQVTDHVSGLAYSYRQRRRTPGAPGPSATDWRGLCSAAADQARAAMPLLDREVAHLERRVHGLEGRLDRLAREIVDLTQRVRRHLPRRSTEGTDGSGPGTGATS